MVDIIQKSDKTLSNYEIEHVCYNMPFSRRFAGVTLSKKVNPRPNEFYVINLADKPPGSHWVAVLRKGRMLLYFDPFGMPPDDIFNHSSLVFCGKKIQPDDSDACGYYVLAWLRAVANSRTLTTAKRNYEEFVRSFGDDPEKRMNELTANMQALVADFRAKNPDLTHHAQHPDMIVGDGFINNILQNLLSLFKRQNYPPKVRDLLLKFARFNVTQCEVQRAPIQQAVASVLDIITLGKLTRNKKKLHYDDIFHLFMVVTLDDPEKTRLLIEKNQVISIVVYKPRADAAVMKVTMPKPILLLEMLENTRQMMGKKYFMYDPIQNNCQDYIMAILDSNKLDTPELRTFVKQDAPKLLESRLLQDSARTLTDLAAVWDRIYHGSGA